MKENFYGKLNQVECNSDIDLYVEEIKNNGFTIIENVLSEDELKVYRQKIDEVYKKQEDNFGLDKLISIKEKNMCRMPLKYDDYFINIATNKTVLEVVNRFLGDFYILNLQNAIINTPNEEHHHSSWHRDLPYQNYVISNPLSINALFCIDEFSENLPFTMTTAQKNAINEICTDLCNEVPMNRLLQGDVGSGKTVVAAASMYFSFKNGYQSALMAPTEILAIQHYNTLMNFFKNFMLKKIAKKKL